MNTRKGLTGIVSIILLLAISIALTSVLFYSVNQYDFTSDDITNPTVSYNPDTNKYTLIKNPDNVPVGVGSTDDNNLNRQFASVGDSLTATNAVLAKTGDSLTVIRDESDSNNSPTLTDLSEPSSSSPANVSLIHDTMSGNGTQSNPYIITNDTQLQSVKHEPNQNYKLGNNIDASLTNNWNGGSGFNPYNFGGVMDGNGHAIKNLYSQRRSALVFRNAGVIKNLSVINATVLGNSSFEVGVIARRNLGVISNVYASGKVTGGRRVGGLIARQDVDGQLKKSYADVNVTGNNAVGGLIGIIFNGAGSIKNSYSVGNVTGNIRVGGVVGFRASEADRIKDVYWDEVSSGQSSDGDGVTTNPNFNPTTGFSTDSDGDGRADEMIGSSAASNMVRLDFTNVWKTVPNEYPRLRNLNGQG